MLETLVSFLNSKVPNCTAAVAKGEAGDSYIHIGHPASITDVAKFLKESEHEFHTLQVISGVDFLETKTIEVNYMVASFTKNQEVMLKVKLPRDEAKLPSVAGVWKAADWQERECYDMLGVIFENHPDFRRILCPDDWEGFPLRKDYQAPKMYKHMEIYPADKMNIEDQEFAAKQKQALAAQGGESEGAVT